MFLPSYCGGLFQSEDVGGESAALRYLFGDHKNDRKEAEYIAHPLDG